MVLLASLLAKEDAELELSIFCNQTMLSVVELEHQPSHKTFNLQSVLPEIYAGKMVAPNLDG